MKKKSLFITGIIIFLISILPGEFKSHASAQTATQSADTTVGIFLFKGKRIPEAIAIEMWQNNEITVLGTNIPKEAIKYYGEKYRNGLFICTPIQE